MPLKPKSGRAEHAAVFLQRAIKDHAERKLLRLPTIKKLAEAAGVSPVTMCKAVGRIAQTGLLSVSQRKGIHIIETGLNSIREADASATTTMPVQRHWENICEQIKQDIITRKFIGGTPLPDQKELMKRFRAGYITVKRALQELERKGKVSRSGRGYMVPVHTTQHRLARLVVITEIPDLPDKNSHAHEFWRLLEAECQRINLRLERITFTAAIKRLSSRSSDVVSESFGYLVLTQISTFDGLQVLLGKLASTVRPVAVLDEGGGTPVPRIALSNPLMRLFIMTTGTLPGKTAGDYLFSHGHRRIAYLSLFSNMPWSIDRLHGLEESFKDAGISNAVIPFWTNRYDDWKAIYSLDSGAEPFETWKKRQAEVQQSINPSSIRNPADLYVRFQPFFWDLQAEVLVRPICEQALAQSEITAWVTDGDVAGINALRFLRKRNIQVPNQISVLGFDNTSEALVEGLTSLDYNTPAVVTAVLDHILTARRTRSGRNKGLLEIPGIVMERSSTGTAPRR